MNHSGADISVLIVEADKHPYMASIPYEEGSLRNVVGGEVDILRLEGDGVGILYDAEGYSCGREPNRMLFDKDGEPYDILCGNFVVVGMDEGHITSLSVEKAERYFVEFYQPTFYGINNDREVTFYEYERKYSRNESKSGESEIAKEWNTERDYWR